MEMTRIDDNEAGFGHGRRATPSGYEGDDSAILLPSAIRQYRRGALKLTATFKSGRADDRRSTPWSMHRGNPHDRNPGCARPPNIKQALRFLQPIGLDVGAQQG